MDPVTKKGPSNSNNSVHKRPNRFEDPVTREDVEVVVKRAHGCAAKVINYHVRTFSEERLGFLGAHRHLVVTIQRDGSVEKEIHTFFLKSVPYNIADQASVVQECKAFFKETSFYTLIMPELISSNNDKSWTAQCYLVKDDALVLEDLQVQNFRLKGKFLDVTALKAVLTALAKLHASSMLAEKRLGKTFHELYPEVVKEYLFVRTGKFYLWFRTGVDVAVAITKRLGLDHTCIPKICDRIFEMMRTSRTRRNAICHGDAKSYNLMFSDSRPLPKCILVDFQLVRYVPAVADVVQLFYLTMRRELRDRNEEELLRHYHEVMCETLRSNDEEFILPSFSEILQEYEEMRVVGLVTSILYAPLNLMDGKVCTDMTDEPGGMSKLLFGDRTDLILNNMEQDSSYGEALAEIVTEMVQRSKQLLSLIGN